MKTTHSIHVHNKKYEYTLEKSGKKTMHMVCKDAGINQDFLTEDIPALLIDLPHLIISEKEYQKSREQNEIIRFRINAEDKKKIELKAIKKGFLNVSEFLRSLALSA